MTTPEGKVKDKVKRLLKKYDVYYFMPVQAGYGAPGLDFHCCANGTALFIETKAGNKKLTPRQENTVMEVQKANGVVFIIHDDSVELSQLEQFLMNVTGKQLRG